MSACCHTTRPGEKEPGPPFTTRASDTRRWSRRRKNKERKQARVACTHTAPQSQDNNKWIKQEMKFNLTTSSYVLACSFPSQSSLPGKSCGKQVNLNMFVWNKSTEQQVRVDLVRNTGWCQTSETSGCMKKSTGKFYVQAGSNATGSS